MLSILKKPRAIRFVQDQTGKDQAGKDRSDEVRLNEVRFDLDPASVSAGQVDAASSQEAAPIREWPKRILKWMTTGLLRSWRRSTARPARLALIERIALGPKQSLVLVEVDGVRLLIATSGEAASAFFSLPYLTSAGSIEDGAIQIPTASSGPPPTGSSRNLRSNTGTVVRPADRAFRRSASEPPNGLWFESRISW